MLLRNVLRKSSQLRFVTNFAQSTSLESASPGSLDRALKTFQFSKERLTDFGDLPRGQVPDALALDPRFDHVKLGNGAHVALEHFNGYHTGRPFLLK